MKEGRSSRLIALAARTALAAALAVAVWWVGQTRRAARRQVSAEAANGESALTGLVARVRSLRKRAARAEQDGRKATLETEEARLALAQLRQRNDGLALEVARLEARLEVASKAAPELPAPGGSDVASRVLRGVAVVDANEALRYVVLGAGRNDGIRPGMTFRVVRGAEVTARLKAADVRADLTGATVLVSEPERFPAPGDRALLGAGRAE
jgi:hypothetical protein